MPKSKVRKKPATRRRPALSESEAMMIPVWEYPEAARAMSRRLGETEEACLEILLSMPVRLWTLDASQVVLLWPAEQARTAGGTVEEWFKVWQIHHELGTMAWDAASKAHYFSRPNTASDLLKGGQEG